MNVGIVQNRIIYGGRLSVILGMVKVLNERGVVPDLVTYDMKVEPDRICELYGHHINFRVRQIDSALAKVPDEANLVAFNIVLHKIYKEYDYFINSNNTSFMMPSRIPVFSYVHFPRVARLKSPYMSIHLPKGPTTRWSSPRGALRRLFRLLYKFDRILPTNYVVTNSKFSRSQFQRYYPSYNKDITVVYPAVVRLNGVIIPLNRRPKIVCSIGRFCREKNQLGQIGLARQLPDWKFRLIGFAGKQNSYLNTCKRYVDQKNINNVEFVINAPLSRKYAQLRQARFFLHPNINEPFGISTTESIMNGCLPLVHNSGGQKEIVPFDELRFDSFDEIPSMLRKVSDSNGWAKHLQEELFGLCQQQFGFGRFRQSMHSQLDYFETAYLRMIK